MKLAGKSSVPGADAETPSGAYENASMLQPPADPKTVSTGTCMTPAANKLQAVDTTAAATQTSPAGMAVETTPMMTLAASADSLPTAAAVAPQSLSYVQPHAESDGCSRHHGINYPTGKPITGSKSNSEEASQTRTEKAVGNKNTCNNGHSNPVRLKRRGPMTAEERAGYSQPAATAAAIGTRQPPDAAKTQKRSAVQP